MTLANGSATLSRSMKVRAVLCCESSRGVVDCTRARMGLKSAGIARRVGAWSARARARPTSPPSR
jgi:hypothetical protein